MRTFGSFAYCKNDPRGFWERKKMKQFKVSAYIIYKERETAMLGMTNLYRFTINIY